MSNETELTGAGNGDGPQVSESVADPVMSPSQADVIRRTLAVIDADQLEDSTSATTTGPTA